ncbi:hypothetical protein [Sinorhizobium meliloti]|uniref:hypothetical protein n=1 Tax=Rhizobium meliloti TaxID=382 RepID=UPI00129797D9|nr:hypothetical protein [Sinorhizobium meliloti]MDW9491729.1 hypothetical protein [Sinorhizobium meliloti]MQV02995.1 hypothetical protein [Sinorhizobium meliloti]
MEHVQKAIIQESHRLAFLSECEMTSANISKMEVTTREIQINLKRFAAAQAKLTEAPVL